MAILNEQTKIGKYSVQRLIKSNLYTETYRAVDEDNNPFFLKLFVMGRIPSKLLNKQTETVKEIEYAQLLKHRNIVGFVEKGTLENEGGKCQYYVTDYLNGQILSDYVQQKGSLTEGEAITIFRGILQGLTHLHQQQPVLCHNDLDPSNVMLSDTADGEPKIIDLGHVSKRCSGIVDFDTSDLDILYHANENMVSIFDEQGDIFSACAVLYFMLSGKAPWQMVFEEGTAYKERFFMLTQHRKAEKLNLDDVNASNKTKAILEKGLALKFNDRFGSIDEILSMLNENPKKTDKPSDDDSDSGIKKSHERGINDVTFDIKRGGGNGFKDIAGMQNLKDYLSQKVIFVIKNKEVAEEYKLVPPNGMLLYGPPGCGKTYFAEKFAEETGFNFILVKSSDLGSSYIHGSQEKISQLFNQAEKNSPIVVCFDEFDALVPDRSASGSQYVSSEVNEFLSQMNNCSKRGIFIVATSNRPDKIDPAILRTGRIDKMVYVPLPDFEARREMFKLYLNQRPVGDDIDFDTLARQTDGYIASDIAFIVNDSAMTAAFSRSKITNQLLQDVIKCTHPSVRKESLRMYDEIQQKMESTGRRSLTDRIGFIHYD